MERMNSNTRNLAGINVLVVEDDYFVASECADLLRGQGANVLGPVPDMDKARDALATGHVDCVLLDVNLKGEMVFELAHELVAKGVPVAFTTGYDVSILPPGLRDAPCLHKPVEVRHLVNTITGLTGRSGPAARASYQA
jgi:DNA-binding response OmpR family regulator